MNEKKLLVIGHEKINESGHTAIKNEQKMPFSSFKNYVKLHQS